MKLKTAFEYWDYLYDNLEIKTIGIIGLYGLFIDFLKQPLQLGFFIPCDKEGKPLEKPDGYHTFKHFGLINNPNKKDLKWGRACLEYQQACDRKIFTGFELHEDTMFNHTPCVIRKSDGIIINIENKTIEDIAKFKVELKEEICKKFKY